MSPKRAVIIGAGPAGLTAAWELLKRTDVVPIVLEQSEYMGGLARTINHNGNRIDLGGHRFFSRSDRVMDWWLKMLPLQHVEGGEAVIRYHGTDRVVHEDVAASSPESAERIMLVRPRKSRIFYLRQLFDYPISLSVDTLRKLGPARTARIVISYLRRSLFPLPQEDTLEQFLINRFGEELYQTFFRSYTEKVWGVPCSEISAEWGAQRIKGLSIGKALASAARKLFRSSSSGDIAQKGTETSLIERFLYPKYGPGQMWDEVARQVLEMGGEIHTGVRVDRLNTDGATVTSLEGTELATGNRRTFEGDYFFSTAPMKELATAMDVAPPARVMEVAKGLVYRDFLTVGLLVPSLTLKEKKAVTDNWIYIQEPDVLIGRLQIFNNWSPWMVRESGMVWLGLEYFCNEGDGLWSRTDEELIRLGEEELAKLGIIEAGSVQDGVAIRQEKTYPAYFGTYDRFPELRDYFDGFGNLFLIGRNGMHRYNNQDHSMLTAMLAVENIMEGRVDKANLWEVNTDQDYHEEKRDS